MRSMNGVSVPKSDEQKRLLRRVAKLLLAAGAVSTIVELVDGRGPWVSSVGLSLLVVGITFWMESQAVVSRAAWWVSAGLVVLVVAMAIGRTMG